MRLSSDRQSSRLPRSFPVGARYVVEGRGGEAGHLQVFARYVVLPGGRHIKLPVDLGQPGLIPPSTRRFRGQKGARASISGLKKIIGRAGTIRQ
jgi:hypothetical protein